MEDSLKTKAIKNSFWNVVASLANKVGAFAFTIILARFLLAEKLGIFSLATALAMFLLTFTDLGLNQAAIRFVSANLKNKKKAAAYFQYLLKIKIYLIIGFLVFLFIIAYPVSVYLFHSDAYFLPIIVAGIYAFFFAISAFFEAMLYAIGKLKYIALRGLLFEVFRISFVLAIFYLFSKINYIYSALFSLIISIILITVIILYLTRKHAMFLFSKSQEKIDKKRIYKFVKYSIIATLSMIFLSYVDTIMLGIFVSASYIGFYKVASSIVFGVTGLLVLTYIFLPIFSQLEHIKLGQAFNKTLKYSMIFIIPASFGLASLASYIILPFGREYLIATPILQVLSFVIIPFVGVSLFLALFSAKEKLKDYAKLTIIVTALNFVLNLLLISLLLRHSFLAATIGASVSILISWSVYFFGLFAIAKKNLKLDISLQAMIKPIIASLLMCLSIFLLKFLLKDINIFSGVLLLVSGAIVYFLVLLIIRGLDFQDFSLIKHILSEK